MRVAFAGKLAGAVRRDRLGKRALVDRRYRVTDQRATGRSEHGTFDAGPPSRIQHLEGAQDVDVEIGRWVRDRHHHRAGRRKMHDGLDPLKRVVQRLGITDVTLDQLDLHAVQV